MRGRSGECGNRDRRRSEGHQQSGNRFHSDLLTAREPGLTGGNGGNREVGETDGIAGDSHSAELICSLFSRFASVHIPCAVGSENAGIGTDTAAIAIDGSGIGIDALEMNIDGREIGINSVETGPDIRESETGIPEIEAHIRENEADVPSIEADVRQIGTSRAANASDSEEIGIDNEAIAVN